MCIRHLVLTGTQLPLNRHSLSFPHPQPSDTHWDGQSQENWARNPIRVLHPTHRATGASVIQNWPSQRKRLLPLGQSQSFRTPVTPPVLAPGDQWRCSVGTAVSPSTPLVGQSLDFAPLGLHLTSEPFPAQPSTQPLPVTGVGSPSLLSQPTESPNKAVVSDPFCFLKTFLEYFILPASSVFGLKVQTFFKCRPWLRLTPN